MGNTEATKECQFHSEQEGKYRSHKRMSISQWAGREMQKSQKNVNFTVSRKGNTEVTK